LVEQLCVCNTDIFCILQQQTVDDMKVTLDVSADQELNAT